MVYLLHGINNTMSRGQLKKEDQCRRLSVETATGESLRCERPPCIFLIQNALWCRGSREILQDSGVQIYRCGNCIATLGGELLCARTAFKLSKVGAMPTVRHFTIPRG